SASWTGSVIAASATLASVVATFVIRFGTAGRLGAGSSPAASLTVSVKRTVYPSQLLPRVSEDRALGSHGESVPRHPGRRPRPGACDGRAPARRRARRAPDGVPPVVRVDRAVPRTPGPPQRPYGRQLAKPARRRRRADRFQQVVAVPAVPDSQVPARGLADGQA